jgi:hypothetical protein
MMIAKLMFEGVLAKTLDQQLVKLLQKTIELKCVVTESSATD